MTTTEKKRYHLAVLGADGTDLCLIKSYLRDIQTRGGGNVGDMYDTCFVVKIGDATVDCHVAAAYDYGFTKPRAPATEFDAILVLSYTANPPNSNQYSSTPYVNDFTHKQVCSGGQLCTTVRFVDKPTENDGKLSLNTNFAKLTLRQLQQPIRSVLGWKDLDQKKAPAPQKPLVVASSQSDVASIGMTAPKWQTNTLPPVLYKETLTTLRDHLIKVFENAPVGEGAIAIPTGMSIDLSESPTIYWGDKTMVVDVDLNTPMDIQLVGFASGTLTFKKARYIYVVRVLKGDYCQAFSNAEDAHKYVKDIDGSSTGDKTSLYHVEVDY